MKPLLDFQLNGSFTVLGSAIDGMTDAEWTSRPYPTANLLGFTVWHCLRTIDWAVLGVAGRGIEMAEQQPWSDVKPDGAFFGAGVPMQTADAVARTVSRRRAGEYLEALRPQVIDWFRSLPPDDLVRIVDLRASSGAHPDHLEAAVWPEVQDLNQIPLWQFLARPCVSHIRVHSGELTAQLQALRASSPT